MEAIEVIELIANGEDSHTQFKQNIRNAESLAGELAAFANSMEARFFECTQGKIKNLALLTISGRLRWRCAWVQPM